MSKAIFSIFKNEAPYLREWVTFHKLQGFEKFYLYNNESQDDWQKEIQDYIDLKYVEVTDYPGHAQQLPAYADFINNFKFSEDKPRWTAFIDIDEFIYCRKGNKVSSVLDDNENFDCIEATWLMFGTNGHTMKPDGLVIDNFTRRADSDFKSDHFKSIVDIGKIVGFSNPHEFQIEGSKINIDDLKINHYWSKSIEEWNEKYKRGRSDTGNMHVLEESIHTINVSSEFEDNTLKDFWLQELKQLLEGTNE